MCSNIGWKIKDKGDDGQKWGLNEVVLLIQVIKSRPRQLKFKEAVDIERNWLEKCDK